VISIKSANEIAEMRIAGKIVKKVLDEIREHIRPGVTTLELDAICESIIKREGGKPAFKGYKGFPGNICASINEVVVHGIPKNKALAGGDIISIDVGVVHNGYFADAARTYKVGKIPKNAQKLMDATKGALAAGIAKATAGERLGTVSRAVQDYAEARGYGVVRALVGHGIGTSMHEDPEIPNYGKAGTGICLKAGMTLAIEPMINEGTFEVEILRDGWAVVTKDNKLSAHFEHTILVTEREAEILT